MANINQPKGFVPSRYQNAQIYNGASNVYCIPAADVNQFNVGDAVKTTAGGDANGIPYITKALGTDMVRGVITGLLVPGLNNPSLVGTNLDLTLQNVPATKLKAYYVLVADDPDLLFELQDDGLTALTNTACNKNASFTVVNPTSPGQNSASVLSTASIGTVSTLNLKLLGLVQKPNNTFGANALWVVKFNLHEFNSPTVGF
jgi:hypothetical protein